MENGALPLTSLPPEVARDAARNGACWGLVSSQVRHGLWHSLFLAAPVVVFALFLAVRARQSVGKLLRSRSNIMATYYAFLWVVAFLNLIWFVLQVRQAKDGRIMSWNIMSLVVSFGMVLLEASVVVFLSQGYLVSGRDALTRTLLCSGLVATADTFIKAVYIFGLGVPLFLAEADAGYWKKWTFWLVRSMLFAGIYLFILILPHTKLRDRLPARPSFYRYAFILFAFNILAAFGSVLIGFGTDFGYCLHGLASFFYSALYPPLLYMTFLADFFIVEDLQMDDVYYSEMKDAGYFDSWD